MQRRFIPLMLCLAMVGAACGGSDGDGIGSDAADGAAEADVAGVPTGCAPILEVANGPGDPEARTMTADDVRGLVDSAGEAKDFVAEESAAAEAYFQIVIDIGNDVLAEFDDDPDLSGEEAGAALIAAAGARQADLADLQVEVIAYLDRTCGLDVSDPTSVAAFGSDDPNAVGADGSSTGTTVAATAMDDGSAGGQGDGSTGDGGSTSTSTTAAPPPAVLEVDDGSVGATGSFWNLDIEIGEIWRTNQVPSEALGGGGPGTDQSWVLVEARVTNDRGDTTWVPADLLRWRDAAGELTSPVEALSPQGGEATLLLDRQTNARIFFVFPAEVGAGDGAAIEIVDTGVVPEIIPLDRGAARSVYPVPLATGDTGSATFDVSACTYDVETEVRGAELELNGEVFDRWNRAAEGRRFVIVELAITLVEASGPSACPGSNIAAFMLETRLEQSNGDRVASSESFEPIEQGETYVDRLVFDVAADTTSLRLLASANGETLATWTDLTIPAP